MIRNIVFDMGQVLIRFEPDLFLDRLNLSKEDRDLLTDQVFYSMEWVRMDRGELVEADVIASACKRLPEHLHSVVETLVAHWDEPILPMPGMEEIGRAHV